MPSLEGPETEEAAIFISYRRRTVEHATHRLKAELAYTFGKGLVFLDVDSMLPGTPYPARLRAAVRNCRVLLAVIGPEWHGTGHRGLGPDDFVRIEIESAMCAGVPVIPVLLDGVQMPGAASLPEPIRRLAEIQAVTFGDAQDFAQPFEKLSMSIQALGICARRRSVANLGSLRPITTVVDDSHPRRSSPIWRAPLFALPLVALLLLIVGMLVVPAERRAREIVKLRYSLSRDLRDVDVGSDLSGLVLEEANLSGMDLSAINLRGADLRRAQLSSSQLAKTSLVDAHLEGAKLRYAQLEGADMTRAHMQDTELSKAKLDGAMLESAELAGAVLEDVSAQHAKLGKIMASKAEFTDAKLAGVDLNGADLSYATAERADFEGADLTETSFLEATLNGASFTAASAARSVTPAGVIEFTKAELASANFSGASLPDSYWQGAQLQGADLSGAVLDDADFTLANLSRADFRDAKLNRVDFTSANLQDALFDGAEVAGALIERAENAPPAVVEAAKRAGADAIVPKTEESERPRRAVRPTLRRRAPGRRSQVAPTATQELGGRHAASRPPERERLESVDDGGEGGSRFETRIKPVRIPR